jgi:kinesin family protein 3/17
MNILTSLFTNTSWPGKNTVQKDFYDESVYPMVESVLEGFNGTIFAYGEYLHMPSPSFLKQRTAF